MVEDMIFCSQRIPENQVALIQELQTSGIPVKLGQLAKQLGLIVKISTLPQKVSGEIRPQGNTFKIRVNRHEARGRQRFTLAHEIAHFLLHKHLIGDGIVDNVLYRSAHTDRVEYEANRLAADLVMPSSKVKELVDTRLDKGEEIDVSQMAEQFEVSEAAMKIRLDWL